MDKVLLVIAHKNYQPLEYSCPKKILTAAGFKVINVSDKTGLAVAQDGSTSKVNLVLEKVDVIGYNGLFIVGGSGALEFLDNERTYKLLRQWQKTGRPYGAICIAPRILAKAGVLENKKATGWDGDNKLAEVFQENSVKYIKETVVRDGQVVTGSGPAAAEEFGQVILQTLN